jgi:hypothetical protein
LAVGVISLAVLAGAFVSDFVVRSFWVKHALTTSLVADLVTVVISVAVINELIERRDRKRWTVLAQSALFSLAQSARVTWTTLVDVLRLTEVHSGSVEPLLEAAQIANDRQRVSEAAQTLLADPERRQRLQGTIARIGTHTSDAIATWATVLVGAAPYARLLDHHVELDGRLHWLSSVLDHKDPPPDHDRAQRRMTLASVATEHADEFDEDWLRDMVVSLTVLATQLDRESRDLAFSLLSEDWWLERTKALAQT